MVNDNLWEELNNIPSPLIDYDNDTDLDLETLLSLDWTFVGTEGSDYSVTTADTYQDSTGTYARKVFNDGFVEFYEIADITEASEPLNEIKRYCPVDVDNTYYLIYWESDYESSSYSLAYISDSETASRQEFISEYLPAFLGGWPDEWNHIHYVKITMSTAAFNNFKQSNNKDQAAFLKKAEYFDEFDSLAFSSGEELESIQRLYCEQNGLDFDSGEANDIWQECGLNNPKWMKAVKEYIKQNY